uniref:Uncharacterized protein n=2 Tax=Desulfobacterium TaxID=2295 RepID=E1YKF7_9BACT|nr:unknown protein [uncultured Desulfobacterium sp.]
MCSISVNSITDEQLQMLEHSGDKNMIEKRLYEYAKEANIQTPSTLDLPKCHMSRMPSDLKDIRKVRIGRHRVYFTGYHTECSYNVFYIKKFKRSGQNDEDNRQFQKILAASNCEPHVRIIEKPKSQ